MPESAPFLKTWIHRQVVDSTSDLARRLVQRGRETLPLAVCATHQTRGRGRGVHRWWSDAGSLTLTLALDPAAHGVPVRREPLLTLATALAVVEAVEPLVPAGVLGIRWPNDIEALGRKLGGILPERIETSAGPRLLIGIGLNVATRLDRAPAEVRRMATSIEELRGAPTALEPASVLFSDLMRRFEANLIRLARDPLGLVERCNALDTLRSVAVRVDQGGRIVQGVGRGIASDGGLRLAVEAGAVTTIHGGQVLREVP